MYTGPIPYTWHWHTYTAPVAKQQPLLDVNQIIGKYADVAPVVIYVKNKGDDE